MEAGTGHGHDLDDLDREYTQAVSAWLELDDPRLIASRYEERVFPLALARLEREALSRTAAHLLILPVGTQPYSPRLVAAGAPAAVVGLLATPGSLDIARSLEEELRASGAEADLRISETDGVSRAEVAELAIRIYRTAGEPGPARTLVDLTSGRKPTVAALASVADAVGAMSCYLEATFHRPPHGGYATNERLVFSPPLRLASAAGALEAPRALARAGLFREAALSIARAGKERYLPPEVRAARHLFTMCSALAGGDPRRAASALRRAVREAGGRSPGGMLEKAWQHWGRRLAKGDPSALDAGLRELRRALGRPGTRGGAAALRAAIRPLFAWLFAAQDRP